MARDVRSRAVERDVALREDLGVARGVDRGDVRAPALQLLRDARRAGEQVERAARARDRRDRAQDRHQPSFRTDVLDHVGGASVLAVTCTPTMMLGGSFTLAPAGTAGAGSPTGGCRARTR